MKNKIKRALNIFLKCFAILVIVSGFFMLILPGAGDDHPYESCWPMVGDFGAFEVSSGCPNQFLVHLWEILVIPQMFIILPCLSVAMFKTSFDQAVYGSLLGFFGELIKTIPYFLILFFSYLICKKTKSKLTIFLVILFLLEITIFGFLA